MRSESELLEFPAELPEMQRGEWLAVSAFDPVIEWLEANQWPGDPPGTWEVARLSSAAYAYRETRTSWSLVAKYHAAKTGADAAAHAVREWEGTQLVRSLGLAAGELRAVRPAALEGSVLFFEYVEGLTLEDTIAVRGSQPGLLAERLALAAGLLAKLHTGATRADEAPDFGAAADYARGVIDNLARYGVLRDEPLVRDALNGLVDAWAARPEMRDFAPVLIHGDPTTTNFVFPGRREAVALDWERLTVADPAADLGRLMAETAHSVIRHGGSALEAEAFVRLLVQSYELALPRSWDRAAAGRRARFYRASSTLRIARNGWLSRLERTRLVVQAMALLGA